MGQGEVHQEEDIARGSAMPLEGAQTWSKLYRMPFLEYSRVNIRNFIVCNLRVSEDNIIKSCIFSDKAIISAIWGDWQPSCNGHRGK